MPQFPPPAPPAPLTPTEDVLFPATSAMGRLCRAHDWAGTPLGPVEGWPQSLRTAASMALRQGIAQNLCWGPELVQIYNDAYRVIMGDKHPAGLGRSVLWSWAEIAGEIGPLFERVWRGETVYFEDLLLRVARHGAVEDAFFTFSYSPVLVESGAVGGVLINCYETTAQVQARALQAERDRLLAALTVERSRLEYVFNRAPAFLAVMRGPDHVFELANAAYYQLVGHRPLVGRPIREALPEVVEQGFPDLLDQVFATGEPFVGREQPVRLARTPDAPPEERFVDFSYLPLIEADGTRSGMIAHGTDVTAQVMARREVERLLRESERERAAADAARQEAEAANRAKAEFLAVMSHELRTPLNAIAGHAQLMELELHGPVTPEQRHALGRVRHAQHHLLGLITDILNHAKLEAGRVEFDVREADVAEVVQGVVPLVEAQLRAKGLELAVVPPPRPLRVWADPEKLGQALLNLLANAVKFTPARVGDGAPGRVTVEWRAAASAAEAAELLVRDTGIGIPPDRQAAIFDPFVQVRSGLTREHQGTGLGLAITRDLVRGMGGDLTVESAEGAGATFTVRLRRVQSARGTPVDRRARTDRRRRERRRGGERDGADTAVGDPAGGDPGSRMGSGGGTPAGD